MTLESVLHNNPNNRILRLQVDNLAKFVASETGIIGKNWDRLVAKFENRILEYVMMRRIRKAFKKLDGVESVEAYLSDMRRGYASGKLDTLSVFSVSSEDLNTDGMDVDDIYENAPVQMNMRSNSTKLMYVPGGGFILPPSRRQVDMVERLAKACDCVAILGQHRLAPENPFPAATQDIADQYIKLLKDTGDANRIFLAADTAGASLVMGALQIIRDKNITMPAGVLLFSPWCDLSLSGWSYLIKSMTADSPFRMESAAFCAKLFLQNEAATEPKASPVFADLTGFPPIAIHTSQYDMHFDDAMTLVENANAKDVECRIHYWDSPRHHLERLNSKDSKQSYAIAAQFINRVQSQLFG